MPQSRQIRVQFPLGGVNRRGGYAQQQAPYSTPMAMNMRGVDALELRRRGGTRPGIIRLSQQVFAGGISCIARVDYTNSSGELKNDVVVISGGAVHYLEGDAESSQEMTLLLDNGLPLLSDSGTPITFSLAITGLASTSTTDVNAALDSESNNAVSHNEKLYIAGSQLLEYNPVNKALSAVTASSGVIPANSRLIASYRGRIILAGADNIWMSSRSGDVRDWRPGGSSNDVRQPAMGRISHGKITAIMNDENRSLSFASRDGLWILNGDPCGGEMVNVSQRVGVLSQGAWCSTDDGKVILLSRDGLYIWQLGSAQQPELFSPEVVPADLLNVNPDENTISMGYDHRSRGVNLFITPSSGRGTHWWIDLKNNALWPVRMPEGMQPVVMCELADNIAFGCKDGYLRAYSPDASNDDGTNIESHVLLGPVHVSGNDAFDGMISEIHASLADNAGSVKWRIITGDSAEGVTDSAVRAVDSALAGGIVNQGKCFGEWGENFNRIVRPRCRGAWGVIWLYSSNRWAFESLMLATQSIGRIK